MMLRGDPTLTQASSPSAVSMPMMASPQPADEETFMQMINEMNRICGDEPQTNSNHNSSNDLQGDLNGSLAKRPKLDHPTAAEAFFLEEDAAAESLLNMNGPAVGDEAQADTLTLHAALDGVGKASPLENLLMSPAISAASPRSHVSPAVVLRPAHVNAGGGSGSGRNPRSRHCSANSSQSGTSFDSAIGDVYSVQTPPRTGGGTSFDFEQELMLDSSSSGASTSTFGSSQASSQDANNVSPQLSSQEQQLQQLLGTDASPPLLGQQCNTMQQPQYQQQQQFQQQQFQLQQQFPQQQHYQQQLQQPQFPPQVNPFNAMYPGQNEAALKSQQPFPSPRFAQKRRSLLHGSPPFLPAPPPHLRHYPPMMMPLHGVHHPHQLLMAQRHEVDEVCIDLMRRFQHACHSQPRTNSHSWPASGEAADPLGVTTRLMRDTLARIRLFLFSLEPMSWLCWRDRNALYAANLCTTSILKAATTVDLSALPAAFPLPYGEYLGEAEALHLILAHDLYNELRSLVHSVQALEIREFPVMLLVIMTAFFTPLHGMEQPDRVAKVHDYYIHKLQIYLNLRFGPASAPAALSSIMAVTSKVKDFAKRLREFLADVTRTGLQKQFESVCENIGLMAFLLQSEPSSGMSSAPPAVKHPTVPVVPAVKAAVTPVRAAEVATAPLAVVENVSADEAEVVAVVELDEEEVAAAAAAASEEDELLLLPSQDSALSSGQQIMADAMKSVLV